MASLFAVALDSAEEEREFCMGLFRTQRPLLVDAEQFETTTTIETDEGPRDVHRGDWVVRGEAGELYVVDDAFFQRTFRPDGGDRAPVEEGRHYGC